MERSTLIELWPGGRGNWHHPAPIVIALEIWETLRPLLSPTNMATAVMFARNFSEGMELTRDDTV